LQGSLAYDHILKFKGKFQNNLTEGFISTCFYTPEKHTYFGGCAGNIAYALAELNVDFDIYGVLGSHDCNDYLERLKRNGISSDKIAVVPDSRTATAYVCTDDEEQQLTFFYPGPRLDASKSYFDFDEDYDLAMVAPNTVPLMIEAFDFAKRNEIDLFFDFGQQSGVLDPDFIKEALSIANITFMNGTELSLLLDRLNMSMPELLDIARTVIVTYGVNPTVIYEEKGKTHELQVESVVDVADPTGCGDAFRAGFIKKYLDGAGMDECVKFAHEVAGACALSPSPQDYEINIY